MSKAFRWLVVLIVLVVVSLPATADVLFYGGDADGANGLASERNTLIPDAMVYDDFEVVVGWTVTGVFGNFLADFTAQQAYYEIRSGVSVGNGGSLIASGTINVTQADTGLGYFGLDLYKIGGEIDPLSLAPGTYWFGMAPIDNGGGRAYIATTSGANGVGSPLNNGNSFFNSSYFGANFDLASNQVGQGYDDFSYGLEGTVVPEPGSMMALGMGALGILPFLRRRK